MAMHANRTRRPDLLSGRGQPVLPAAAACPRRARHDAGVLQLPETLGQQRARHEGDAALQLAEARASAQELPEHERRPPLGDDLAGLRHRAELTVGLHGGDYRNRPDAEQVHFLILRDRRPGTTVEPSDAISRRGNDRREDTA